MRIISKFKDYYDGVARLGIDKSIVYPRFTREEKKNLPEIYGKMHEIKDPFFDGHFGGFRGNISYNYMEPTIILDVEILGFCGKYYPIFSMYYTSSRVAEPKESVSHSSVDKIPELLGKGLVAAGASIPYIKSTLSRFRQEFYGKTDKYNHLTSVNVSAIGERIEKFTFQEPFFNFETPIFLLKGSIRTPELIINPCLKNIGFMSTMDPWTAFQELSMFVGGVLPQKHKMPCLVTNDDMIRDTHGFDKNSFRSSSPGRKSNRAKNKLRKLKNVHNS